MVLSQLALRLDISRAAEAIDARVPSDAVAGGTSIEDLAEKFPDKIVKVPIDVREGITDEQA